MKYYVVSDVHSYFDEMEEALTEKGYFSDAEPHKLIICGDLFDRGPDAKKMQMFVLEKLRSDECILIKGNHEDLLESLLCDMEFGNHANGISSHHFHNGTVDTVAQLTDMTIDEVCLYPYKAVARMKATPLMKEIIPSMLDYFETDHYVFVHGWIPVFNSKRARIKQWRKATALDWIYARWSNGMDMARDGWLVHDKTVVCGHFYCGYGRTGKQVFVHSAYEPYYAEGIIAIDSSVANTQIINCLVIED